MSVRERKSARGIGSASGGSSFLSERNPARQIRNPWNPSLRIGFESEQGKTNWSKVWDSSNGCVSFFFKNFSESIDLKTLFLRFKEFDKVRDVYISLRGDKEGKRFGFVRFGSSIGVARVEQRLNDIWFGSYKMRVNVARFSRSLASVGKSNHVMKSAQPKKITLIQLHNRKITNVSYAQAMKEPRGFDTPRVVLELKSEMQVGTSRGSGGLRYDSLESDRKWLEGCLTGKLKESYPWSEVGSKIQESCDESLKVIFLGGDLVLIQSAMKDVITESEVDCIAKWFEAIEPWSEFDVIRDKE